jgi:hypothetical protein
MQKMFLLWALYRSHFSEQEIQRTGLSEQVPSLTNNDTLKIATIVQQIMTELSEDTS